MSGANEAQCRLRFCPPSLHALEQNAFEGAAMLRTIGINPASAGLQRGAWLREPRRAACRPRIANRQPSRPQSRRIVVRLQPNIGKYHPIAAQTADKTKLSCDGGIGVG
jgi:hypothetical protein